MSSFQRPPGQNFHCRESIPLTQLARDLQRVTAFLQQYWLDLPLNRFDDWLDLDGRPIYRPTITFDTLQDMVSSPQAIYVQMPGEVHIGIAPLGAEWYLRFYADWDSDGQQLVGKFDLTLPPRLADRFGIDVVPRLSAAIAEDDAEHYFADPDDPEC